MEATECKGIKAIARDAKKRMKSGFWQRYHDEVIKSAEIAKEEGINSANVIKFYEAKILRTEQSSLTKEDGFYLRVKNMLESEGEVSDAIGRLIDHEIFDSMEYERKQKYLFELAEKYRNAVERYRREKKLV